jgi:hypothetical protein
MIQIATTRKYETLSPSPNGNASQTFHFTSRLLKNLSTEKRVRDSAVILFREREVWIVSVPRSFPSSSQSEISFLIHSLSRRNQCDSCEDWWEPPQKLHQSSESNPLNLFPNQH